MLSVQYNSLKQTQYDPKVAKEKQDYFPSLIQLKNQSSVSKGNQVKIPKIKNNGTQRRLTLKHSSTTPPRGGISSCKNESKKCKIC